MRALPDCPASRKGGGVFCISGLARLAAFAPFRRPSYPRAMDLTERTHPGWTMADAERLDLTNLEIRCQCGRIVQYPWRLLPPIPANEPVVSIAGRLVCKRCGHRPHPDEMTAMNPLERVPKNMLGRRDP